MKRVFGDIRKYKSFSTLKRNVLKKFPENYHLPENENACWLWKGYTNQKYGQIKWGQKNYYAHRLSYIIFNGPLYPDEIVRHTCDNPLCVNPKHLIKGDQAMNEEDKLIRGSSPRRKLNSEAVKVIRWMLKYKNYSGLASKLAKLHNVPESTIHTIKNGTKWKHVKIT